MDVGDRVMSATIPGLDAVRGPNERAMTPSQFIAMLDSSTPAEWKSLRWRIEGLLGGSTMPDPDAPVFDPVEVLEAVKKNRDYLLGKLAEKDATISWMGDAMTRDCKLIAEQDARISLLKSELAKAGEDLDRLTKEMARKDVWIRAQKATISAYEAQASRLDEIQNRSARQ